jgi:hypothetical protein
MLNTHYRTREFCYIETLPLLQFSLVVTAH